MGALRMQKSVDKYILGSLCYAFGIFVSRRSSPPKKIRKILIIKLWALGDTVNSLPMIKRIKERYPDADIDVLARDSNRQVYENQPYIHNIISFEPKKIFDTLKLFRRYDLSFDLEPYLNISALLGLYTSRYKVGFEGKARSSLYNKTSFFYKDTYIAQGYMKMLESFTGHAEKITHLERLNYSKNAKASVDDILKKYKITRKSHLIGFCASVGASIKEREWPKDRFKKLAASILKKKKDSLILLIGVKNDYELNEYIRNDDPRIINLSGKLKIEELFCLMERFDLFITNDTGPMHVAAAQGTRTIALFGVSFPQIWGPYSKNSTVIFHPKKGCPYIDSTTHSLVPKVLTEEQKTCMDSITVEEVLKKI